MLTPLMELASDEDATCKTKVWEVTVGPLDLDLGSYNSPSVLYIGAFICPTYEFR